MSALQMPNGQGGRDRAGRFVAGNTFARGNPLGQHAQKLRAALMAAATEEDIEAIAKKLIELARAGDVKAIDSLLDRLLGKPVPADLQERVERLEVELAERSVTR